MVGADHTELVFEYPALPDRVWDALTNGAKLSTWLTDNDFAPVPGQRFVLGANGFPGLPDPVLGEVVEVEPPVRLVMRWRSGNSRAVVTWLVEPARGGSRLRVIQTGVLGHPMRAAELAQVYQILYGERLRLLLRTGMLHRLSIPVEPPPRPPEPVAPRLWLLPDPPSDPPAPSRPPVPEAPPPDPADPLSAVPGALYPPGTPEGGRSGETPVVFPIIGLPAPPPRRRRGRWALVGWPLGVLVVLLLLLAGWGFAVGSGPGGGTDHAGPVTGPDGHPTASAADPTPAGTVNAAIPGGSEPQPSTVVSPAGSGSTAGPVGTTTAGPTGAPALDPMTVTYRTTSQGLLKYSVAVSVTNPAGSPQTWRSVSLRLSGVSLSVQPVDAWVSYRAVGAEQCFVPSAAKATVGAGGTVTFSVTVSSVLGGVLGEVDRATLDVPACA